MDRGSGAMMFLIIKVRLLFVFLRCQFLFPIVLTPNFLASFSYSNCVQSHFLMKTLIQLPVLMYMKFILPPEKLTCPPKRYHFKRTSHPPTTDFQVQALSFRKGISFSTKMTKRPLAPNLSPAVRVPRRGCDQCGN